MAQQPGPIQRPPHERSGNMGAHAHHPPSRLPIQRGDFRLSLHRDTSGPLLHKTPQLTWIGLVTQAIWCTASTPKITVTRRPRGSWPVSFSPVNTTWVSRPFEETVLLGVIPLPPPGSGRPSKSHSCSRGGVVGVVVFKSHAAEMRDRGAWGIGKGWEREMWEGAIEGPSGHSVYVSHSRGRCYPQKTVFMLCGLRRVPAERLRRTGKEACLRCARVAPAPVQHQREDVAGVGTRQQGYRTGPQSRYTSKYLPIVKKQRLRFLQKM